MEFNERLKCWIKDNNIKQKDIAEKADVNKSYISNLVSGRSTPSEHIIEVLADMSNHSVHWWLFGKEEYDNLNSLNELINMLIKIGKIKPDGTYNDDIKEMLLSMLNDEIKDKLEEKKKAQEN